MVERKIAKAEQTTPKEGGFRREFYIAIVVSVLMTFLVEPLFKFIWGSVVSFSSYTYSNYLNSIYRSAALGDRNYVDVILILFLYEGVAMGYVLATLSLLRKREAIRSFVNKQSPKVVNTIMIVLTLVAITFLQIGAFRFYADLQLTTSFQQRMTVLAPVISDQEYKELAASWASMKNRDDFLVITESMESTAQSKEIQLPELLLK